MSLLANAIINCPLRRFNSEIDRIASLLSSPFEQNHMPAFGAVSLFVANEAKAMAPVYQLDRSASDAAWAIMFNKRRADHVLSSCRAPHLRMFLEWFAFDPERENYAHFGAFTEGDRDDLTYTLFRFEHETAMPLFSERTAFGIDNRTRLVSECATIEDMPFALRFFRIKSYDSGKIFPDEESQEEARVYFGRYVAAAWAFLGINGAVTVSTKITREGRKAQKRGRARAAGALHSFNRVRLNLPANDVFSSSTQFRNSRGVRLHDVRGHWRELEHDGQMILRWIAAYWRGNAALGVIVKEREVRFSNKGRGAGN